MIDVAQFQESLRKDLDFENEGSFDSIFKGGKFTKVYMSDSGKDMLVEVKNLKDETEIYLIHPDYKRVSIEKYSNNICEPGPQILAVTSRGRFISYSTDLFVGPVTLFYIKAEQDFHKFLNL